MVHRLAVYLTNKANALSVFDTDEYDIYVYAFEKIISQAITYLFLLIIGILMKSFVCMIVYIIFLTMLRGQTSGYHAKSPIECTILSCIVSTVSIIISKTFLTDKFIFVLPILLLSVIYIVHMAPINHANLNLSSYERKRMRKLSRRILLYEIILICLFCIFPITRAMSIPASLAIITVVVFMILSKTLNQEDECNVNSF